MSTIDYVVLFLYFATMIAIGIWAMRRVQKQEDYFLGGRGFGKLLQTFAAFGAGTGAHEPGTVGRTVWTSGLSGVWSALMWLFVTPIYWITAVWYRRMRHLTLGDWFVERYESRALGAAYTVFALTFYMFYLSTMFSAIAKFAAPLMGFNEIWGMELQTVLIPTIAAVVIAYGVLGGLTAAYWTDLIQGIFIIVLSVLLIPYGLWALVTEFGDPATQGISDGFTILHQRVSADYFGLFDGPAAGEFPIQYIISLTLLAIIGIVVQPHFIATGGGSAKDENDARIGLVVGNFLKRLCTVGWALTALIALALLAGNPEIIKDPDQVWGVAAREILGPLNMGLVGLMLACLLAAMMSSADTYMIVSSGLVVRNVFAAYISPDASEQTCLRVARVTGLVIIVGASVVAMKMSDVFGQFKLAMELPILFAAPFWIGMYWRRANRTAVWITIATSALLFFVLPIGLTNIESLRTSPAWTQTTNIETRTTTRPATAADVARYEAWTRLAAEEPDDAGAAPPNAVLGEPIEVVTKTGGNAIFWKEGVEVIGTPTYETLSESTTGNTHLLVQRHTGPLAGKGWFNIDFIVYHWLGIDLASASKATLETLRLPPRLLFPFVVLMLASLITPRNSKLALDRYYAKMNTEVDADPSADQAKLQAAFADPTQYDSIRLFPRSDWEFTRPRPKDWIGFLVSVAVCFVIVGLLAWLAGIGS
ncbi:sodium:solute symporter family protein [Stieleria sp. TO1_6]|uniref:sodium:solute symporter family protein n=1 Tax=Stieleria tagensis TaxID=2956795 RepID=UPI00209AF879|nr:sodium:solute symporter family protein [Stieleria tagensis]MCO8124480.1 sodium:solute symporter family protein [Stieleria tagensis]